jgi:hypothetical protein
LSALLPLPSTSNPMSRRTATYKKERSCGAGLVSARTRPANRARQGPRSSFRPPLCARSPLRQTLKPLTSGDDLSVRRKIPSASDGSVVPQSLSFAGPTWRHAGQARRVAIV